MNNLIGRFPADAVERIGETYRNSPHDVHYSFVKYFGWREFLQEKINFVIDAGLDKRKPGTLLDIGSGTGYFPWVARELGWQVAITDLPDSFGESIICYKKILAVLGLQRNFELHIRPLIRIPNEIGKYDFIAITGGCFHKKWTPEMWAFLISDLSDHLNKPGALFFHLVTGGVCESGYKAFLDVRKQMKGVKKSVNSFLLEVA
jgi:SAM-dependent methyltransferase